MTRSRPLCFSTADAKTLREDDSADELTRLRTRLKESRQTFRDARGGESSGVLVYSA